MMDITVNKGDIIKDPLVEHPICSFASSSKGYGALICVTNMITKEVYFIVESKYMENISNVKTSDLDDAITLYNLLTT